MRLKSNALQLYAAHLQATHIDPFGLCDLTLCAYCITHSPLLRSLGRLWRSSLALLECNHRSMTPHRYQTPYMLGDTD